MKNLKLIPIFCIILLLVAILPLPDVYYAFLNLVINFSAVIFAFILYKNTKDTLVVILFITIALFFNPVFNLISPFYFDKSTWVAIDMIAASVFLYPLLSKDKDNILKVDNDFQAIVVLYIVILYSLLSIFHNPCKDLTGPDLTECQQREEMREDYNNIW